MKAPEKIYVREYPDGVARFWEEKKKDDVVATIPYEYIRKDVVDEMLKTAEDHAYFAGQEKLRERLLEWAKTERAKCSDETHPYAQFMNVVINELNSL